MFLVVEAKFLSTELHRIERLLIPFEILHSQHTNRDSSNFQFEGWLENPIWRWCWCTMRLHAPLCSSRASHVINVEFCCICISYVRLEKTKTVQRDSTNLRMSYQCNFTDSISDFSAELRRFSRFPRARIIQPNRAESQQSQLVDETQNK